MMTFYAAAGSYQIRSEDGKNMPYIMRQGKLQPVSIPEFSLWSIRIRSIIAHNQRALSGHSPDSAQISTVLQTGQLCRHDRQR